MKYWGHDINVPLLRNLILGIALSLHVIVAFLALRHGHWITDDTVHYFRLANNLWERGVWSQAWMPPFVPDHQRTPGYPLLILLCLQSPILLIVLQHLMVLATGWLIRLHMLRKADQSTASWAGILYILNPYAIGLASFGLSETASIFFMVLAWQQISLRNGWKSVCMALVSLSIAAYIRPNALALAGIWCLWGFVLLRQKKYPEGLRKAFAGMMVFILMLPWMIRVHGITGRYTPSTVADIASVNGRMGGMFIPKTFPHELDLYHVSDSVFISNGIIPWKYYPEQSRFHENQVFSNNAQETVMTISWQNPDLMGAMYLRSMVQMFSGSGTGWIQAATGVRWLGFGLGGLQIFLTIILVIRFFSRFKRVGWENKLITLGAALALWFPALSLLADGRYRFAAEWLFWML